MTFDYSQYRKIYVIRPQGFDSTETGSVNSNALNSTVIIVRVPRLKIPVFFAQHRPKRDRHMHIIIEYPPLLLDKITNFFRHCSIVENKSDLNISCFRNKGYLYLIRKIKPFKRHTLLPEERENIE